MISTLISFTQQELSIERIEIHMGDTARPLRMKIFKTEKVLPIDWKPWIYRVTDEADCKNVYGISNPIKIPTGENTPICSKYPESNRDPRTGQIKANEKVSYVRTFLFQTQLHLDCT